MMLWLMLVSAGSGFCAGWLASGASGSAGRAVGRVAPLAPQSVRGDPSASSGAGPWTIDFPQAPTSQAPPGIDRRQIEQAVIGAMEKWQKLNRQTQQARTPARQEIVEAIAEGMELHHSRQLAQYAEKTKKAQEGPYGKNNSLVNAAAERMEMGEAQKKAFAETLVWFQEECEKLRQQYSDKDGSGVGLELISGLFDGSARNKIQEMDRIHKEHMDRRKELRSQCENRLKEVFNQEQMQTLRGYFW